MTNVKIPQHIQDEMDELIIWAPEVNTENEYEDFEQAEQELFMLIELEPNAEELYAYWEELINKVVWNIPEGKNRVIHCVNLHNDECARKGRTADLLNEAVRLCCDMRANGFPAVVDTYTAQVVCGNDVITGGRYLTFVWHKD